MSELELKIEKLIKDQILITESEAQDLATLICELPEIKGGRVGAEVIMKTADMEKLEKEFDKKFVHYYNSPATGDERFIVFKKNLKWEDFKNWVNEVVSRFAE